MFNQSERCHNDIALLTPAYRYSAKFQHCSNAVKTDIFETHTGSINDTIYAKFFV